MDRTITRLFEIAHALMPSFLEIHKHVLGGRTGVYLAVRHRDKEITDEYYGEVIGYLSEDKVSEKEQFACEKIDRMKKTNTSSSFETEDYDNKQYGGGIRTKGYYIAPSGFPPHLDQKFAILITMMAEEMTMHELYKIVSKSVHGVQQSRLRNNEPSLQPESL